MIFSAARPVPARRARLAPATLLAVLAATLGLVTASVTLTAAPASAHDVLVSSDPADGAELAESPTQITLTFNNDLSTLGGLMVLTDASGTEVASAAPTVEGPTATLPLEPLPGGVYTLTWRAVSSDSHPIEGTSTFTVAQAEPLPVEPDPSPSAEQPPAADAPEASAEPSATATPVTTSDEPDAAADDDGPLPWVGILVGAGLGLAAGAVLTVWTKRRNRKD